MEHNESLKTLHAALIDASKGYSTAFDNGQTPDMKAFFQSMQKLHEAAHADLHKILTSRGEAVHEDVSFMATVHEAVISVRAAVVGLDRNSLDSFADGEDHILHAYSKAIADQSPDAAVVQMLKKHRSALASKIGEMRRRAI